MSRGRCYAINPYLVAGLSVFAATVLTELLAPLLAPTLLSLFLPLLRLVAGTAD
ncbi:MAG: hypothetical protein HC866_26280 [Leptolyngbyaceae cyanobacterium RU_5_1]|nr:hypothetical protein [Leptolyngbyaceae cyanobacterium RU_5_1]